MENWLAVILQQEHDVAALGLHATLSCDAYAVSTQAVEPSEGSYTLQAWLVAVSVTGVAVAQLML